MIRFGTSHQRSSLKASLKPAASSFARHSSGGVKCFSRPAACLNEISLERRWPSQQSLFLHHVSFKQTEHFHTIELWQTRPLKCAKLAERPEWHCEMPLALCGKKEHFLNGLLLAVPTTAAPATTASVSVSWNLLGIKGSIPSTDYRHYFRPILSIPFACTKSLPTSWFYISRLEPQFACSLFLGRFPFLYTCNFAVIGILFFICSWFLPGRFAIVCFQKAEASTDCPCRPPTKSLHTLWTTHKHPKEKVKRRVRSKTEKSHPPFACFSASSPAARRKSGKRSRGANEVIYFSRELDGIKRPAGLGASLFMLELRSPAYEDHVGLNKDDMSVFVCSQLLVCRI